MPMAPRSKLDRQTAVEMLSAAVSLGDREAAIRYGVSLRTLFRARKRWGGDTEVAALVIREKAAIRPVLRSLLTDALTESVSLGLNLARGSDNLYHVAGFVKILSDALVADTVVEKGLGGADGGLGEPGAGASRPSPTLAEAPRRALAILSGGKRPS